MLKKLFFFWVALLAADNQTEELTPILPEDGLPFTVAIEKEALELPAGYHSGATATYQGQWILLAGRTNGNHGFGPGGFPSRRQNTAVYVIDFENQKVYTRDLKASGLTSEQIEDLSVTNSQYFTLRDTLYVVGGYVFHAPMKKFVTKSTLTAIDLPELVEWVKSGKAPIKIRQTSDPWIQVTGGRAGMVDESGRILLVFGQNFEGAYRICSNGIYTCQVRAFQVVDEKGVLAIQPLPSESPREEYRRRDLNVVPIIYKEKPALLALSGVFTPTTGVWTLPVLIKGDGSTKMEDPTSPESFKQGMNNYLSATLSLYSSETQDNYILQLGGISFGYYENGAFLTDCEFPFINQATTVKMDRRGTFSQYLNRAEYPPLFSGERRLIFGTDADVFTPEKVPTFFNQIIDLDKLEGPTVVGYIVGGIMSTLPNTVLMSDSSASPYIFRVVVTPSPAFGRLHQSRASGARVCSRR